MGKALEVLDLEIQEKITNVNGRLAVRQRVEKELDLAVKRYAQASTSLLEIQQAAVIIASVESAQQKELKEKIEKLISYGLTTIFGKPYQFILVQEPRGNQTETTFCIKSPEYGDKPIPLKDARGGGLVVFCAFLLRFILLISAKPAPRAILVADEPFVAISADFRNKLGEFLRQLAEKADMQFILVTHEPELAEIGDKSYRFKLVHGLTKVETIK